ncbi:dapper homolog 1 [Mugil cephalus]|uniref:dapper homolog 1 n=1 Tax=Mugil cephalus TaxID=48193 RepID=UPI001FB6F3F0|nr:dapper homolog 1 [Mugil cephalus]
MPLPGRCSREKAAAVDADAAERLCSVRERLEATVSGLEELELLRHRQEQRVRATLNPGRKEAKRSSEEKLLEENILVLRKQLNCLRRRDVGLISQLQELDRQISDLQLDTAHDESHDESHDQLETDSRPSSGFFELSDGASGSLSNSSNSVFSECFCWTVDAGGCLPSTDELASCLECEGLVGKLCDDSATVHCSLSAPHPTVDVASSMVSTNTQSKYHCDLVSQNSGEIYCYPSPMHAVTVQSPAFLQMLGHGGHSRDETEVYKPETSPLLASVSVTCVPQSSSWPISSSPAASQTPSHKRLDNYIYSLLQRKAQSIRVSRPRTSISTEPSKSILRQASLCGRQPSGPTSSSGTLWGSDLKSSSPVEGVATSSSQRQWSVESDTSCLHSYGIQNSCSVTNKSSNTSTNGILRKNKLILSYPGASTTTKDFKEPGSLKANPEETKQSCCPNPDPDQELFLKSHTVLKTQSGTPRNSPESLNIGPAEKDVAVLGSCSQSQNERRESYMVNGRYVPTQQSIRHCKGDHKNDKNVKVKSTVTPKKSWASEHKEPTSERRRDKSHRRLSSRKSQQLEDGGSAHIKVSKRGGSSRVKRFPPSIPEGPDRHVMSSTLNNASSCVSKHCHHANHGKHLLHGHHHYYGRDHVVVVAKPKYKRNGYRRLRAIMEVTYDEAFRRTQRRQRKHLLSNSAVSVDPPASPRPCVAGSDSEYSAECASLFHSTIVDTSEDERSNYTTNCFGDSESSQEEKVEESTPNTSDTEESGGSGAWDGSRAVGRGWDQLRSVGQEMIPAEAKAFVKIKASRNLKKKILRFRSGSLKVMTTV